MEKINIISERMIVESSTFGQILQVAAFLALSIGALCWLKACLDWDISTKRIIPIIIGLFLVCFTVLGQYYLIPYVSTDTGRKEYKCTINEDIPFNEITKMYNIVEYDNKNNVWTLEDKERKNK